VRAARSPRKATSRVRRLSAPWSLGQRLQLPVCPGHRRNASGITLRFPICRAIPWDADGVLEGFEIKAFDLYTTNVQFGQASKSETTREAIKDAAQRLFAVRGVDGVAVREIVKAAGQRNSGALHYYFRTKEDLVRELIVEGAKLIDRRRNALLDDMERNDGPRDLRQIIEVLVLPATGLGKEAGTEETYLRFITALQMNHYALFMDALQNKWNSGYQRCLSHIRQLLSEMPSSILRQRMVFMGLLLNAALAAREAAFDDRKRAHPFWCAPHTLENLIDTIQSMLVGEISQSTWANLEVSPLNQKAMNGERLQATVRAR
jgi:AcrR family transcriptional regulator